MSGGKALVKQIIQYNVSYQGKVGPKTKTFFPEADETI